MRTSRWFTSLVLESLVLLLSSRLAHAQASPLSNPHALRAEEAAKPAVPGSAQGVATGSDFGSTAHAEVTLTDLIELALNNNPTLTQAAARIEMQRGAWVQGALYPNPSIGYNGTQIGDSGRAGQQGLYLAQPFVAPQKLALNRATTAQDIARADQLYAAQRQRVISDVTLRYFDVLYAQRAIDLTRVLLGIGEQGQKAAEELLRGEHASRIDVLQSRVEVHTSRINLRRAENRHQAAWQALLAVTGTPLLGPRILAGDLGPGSPQLEFQPSLERILAVSPELKAAQVRVERERLALARARVEPYPDADLQYMPQHDNTTADNIHSIQAYISIPLFNRNQGNIAAAQARLLAAQGDVERVSLELRNRLASAFERYANALQQQQQYAEFILPDAQESLNLVRASYAHGQVGYLQLLTSQRTFFQANLAYLDSLRELRQSATFIEGLLLADSLETPFE